MLDVHKRLEVKRKEFPEEKDPLPHVAKDISEETWLLCFDEFQVSDIADAMILGRLFEGLFALGSVIVATSNRAPDDLYKNGLQRDRFLPFIELFKRKMDVHSLDSEQDYRLRHIDSLENKYFFPLGENADLFLKNSYITLTDGLNFNTKVLDVGGRKITVNKCADGVAWFSFNELCGKPYGVADYLAIAEEFPTILLENIPVLSPENRNEAKRFVNLIDAFYEKKITFICTAEAAAEDLYVKGDGSFEFERTVSRLIEMQKWTIK
jgi:cell division protein ZapE